MKKDQNLPNKNIHSNNSSGDPLPDNYKVSRQQSSYRYNYRGRSPDQKNSRNFSQNRYSRSNNQNNQYPNNYSRSTQTEEITQIKTGIVQIQTPEIDFIQTTVLEIHHTIETETIQTTETDNIKITDHETIQTIDQTLIIIIIDHVTILKNEIQIIQVDKEIFLNHRTEIKHNIKTHNKSIEVVHLNIKDKLTKYNQLKKLNQTLPVLITQKPQNYTSVT